MPPSLSDLSLQSASSGTSWQSPSSTSSRKHSLELPFDGSPQPKRRLLAEMAGAAAAFRYSAPCPQSSFGSDGSERRGGFLRRSGAPIQSLLAATEIDGPSPSIAAYFGSDWERDAETWSALHDPFCPRPQPSNRADVTSAPVEQQQVRKKKAYSFWRFTSPPIVESAVPEVCLVEEEPTSGTAPLPGPKSTARTVRLNLGRPGLSARPHQETEPQRMIGAGTTEGEGGARLDALDTLEGTREEISIAQDDSNPEIKGFGEEKPIIMCGERLYSDWAGNWSRWICNPLPHVSRSYSLATPDGVPRKIPGAGALFPEGYLPRVGSPEPWICPVRDCQTIFADAWALGGHFSVGCPVFGLAIGDSSKR